MEHSSSIRYWDQNRETIWLHLGEDTCSWKCSWLEVWAMDRVNNPKYPDTHKNKQRHKTCLHSKWDAVSIVPGHETGEYLHIFHSWTGLWHQNQHQGFVLFERHTVCLKKKNAYHQISRKSLVSLFLAQTMSLISTKHQINAFIFSSKLSKMFLFHKLKSL